MMQGREDDVVERLYHRLAEALEGGRGFGGPVTVAEIYQELVPYRLVRSDVGFGMNADYEHALLRLLAGERGLARLDPEEAVRELRRELDSPNPNLGAYRDLAGCDVWVSARPATAPERPAAGGPAEPVRTAPTGTAAATFSFAEPAREPAGGVEQEPAPEPAAEAVEEAADRCAYCDSELPSHRAVLFCPFCGADQRTRPCGACGEIVEPGWGFCVACGATRD
jgi:hypothetical protein